jgi:signal transduction histidine kinase
MPRGYSVEPVRTRGRPIGASRGGLTRRLIVASAVLALLIGGAFLVLLFAIGDVREDQRRTDHSQQLLIAANGLERLLLDLETGARGFILTGQDRFLGPWNTARAELPGRAAAAQRLAASEPETAQRTARIVRDMRAYVADYSMPLVDAALRGDPSARSDASATEGRRRVDAMRGEFDQLLQGERRVSASSSASSSSAARRASAAAAIGVAGSIALIVLYAGYLTRVIIRPVRQAATMAGRIAGGDLSARMPETGPGEVGALESTFNVMAGKLEQSRDERAEAQAELAASRARIVATADETRRQIERDLHDGAQQRLVTLALELRGAQAAVPPELPKLKSDLDEIAAGVTDVFHELREMARGIHPAILAEGGLGPGLKTLARRSAVPVELDVQTQGRLPAPVEVGTYFVVSEALTNAAKHAQAWLVRVDVDAVDGMLHVCVRDDGVGGADFERGSGLVGLKDRVEALGGRIAVESPHGAGTAVRVELPLSGAPD